MQGRVYRLLKWMSLAAAFVAVFALGAFAVVVLRPKLLAADTGTIDEYGCMNCRLE